MWENNETHKTDTQQAIQDQESGYYHLPPNCPSIHFGGAFHYGRSHSSDKPFSQIPSHLPSSSCHRNQEFFFFFFFPGVLLGGYLVGNSKQPFGQLKAMAIQLYPSRQQPFADKQPRHKAVVSCRAVAHHFPSQTTAVE